VSRPHCTLSSTARQLLYESSLVSRTGCFRDASAANEQDKTDEAKALKSWRAAVDKNELSLRGLCPVEETIKACIRITMAERGIDP
jgi:hypothetical protein